MTERNIFISHSSLDKDYGRELSNLFTEITHRKIFFSSSDSQGVPVNKDIYATLREEIKKNAYVIFLLSKHYYESPACLNEMGAAWACGNEYALMCLPGSDIASEEFQRSVINTNQKVVHLQNVTEMKQLVETILDTFGLSYDEGLIHEKCLDFAHQISKKSEKSAYTQLWEAEKKMKQNRDLLNAYYERGNVWKKLGNYENAIKDYLFSIFLNPKNPNAYECVVKWAIEDCDKAIAMEENFWYYNTRGCSKLEKARYFEALTDFYRSHQLSPNYEPALRHLKYIVETIKPEVLLQEAENQKKSGNVLLAEIYLNCLKLTGKLSFEKR